jgi:porin
MAAWTNTGSINTLRRTKKKPGPGGKHFKDDGPASHPEFAGRCVISVLALIISLACADAHAQSSPNTGASSSGAVSSSNAALPPALSLSAPEAPAVPPADPYARYEWKGLNVFLPSPTDTVDGDLFGYRQKLGDEYGIGYFGLSVESFYDNVLQHGHDGPQAYVGQQATGLSENIFVVTFDLSRYGIPDGQIVAGASYVVTSWNEAGPNTINLGQLTYYQTLFNKRVEFKIGLLSNSLEYLNNLTGTNYAGGVYGPTSFLLAETGSSETPFPTYGINVNVHITKKIYDKFGVARSVSALGPVAEHNFNPSGAQFTTPRSGVWVINELGYLQPPEPGRLKTWIRAGAVYNGSPYTKLANAPFTSSGNHFFYLVADQQLLQVSSTPDKAYRGLYGGFSIEYSPSKLNLFAQYYEARVYSLGLLPSRPFDQTSFVFGDSVFSSSLYNELRAAGQKVHSDSMSFTGSYSYHLMPGVYLKAALQYIDNPTPLVYQSNTGSALNIVCGATIFF